MWVVVATFASTVNLRYKVFFGMMSSEYVEQVVVDRQNEVMTVQMHEMGFGPHRDEWGSVSYGPSSGGGWGAMMVNPTRIQVVDQIAMATRPRLRVSSGPKVRIPLNGDPLRFPDGRVVYFYRNIDDHHYAGVLVVDVEASEALMFVGYDSNCPTDTQFEHRFRRIDHLHYAEDFTYEDWKRVIFLTVLARRQFERDVLISNYCTWVMIPNYFYVGGVGPYSDDHGVS